MAFTDAVQKQTDVNFDHSRYIRLFLVGSMLNIVPVGLGSAFIGYSLENQTMINLGGVTILFWGMILLSLAVFCLIDVLLAAFIPSAPLLLGLVSVTALAFLLAILLGLSAYMANVVILGRVLFQTARTKRKTSQLNLVKEILIGKDFDPDDDSTDESVTVSDVSDSSF
ncbi:hypothetical protein J8273_8232 [Carpediemonas membranifera]|uniref:Uncharacterized protein n=1 Tax=Carpediemonas membranifera TaxID=201153 RepID=A0A8J6B520_9EUKA|nr:hypothetical protein J8273_8232 [Carpediemonas membranifera]|eukprot:KAG9390192.1 hypothetical protein J8273_8232 [Carpediemonas membranifera]